MVWHAMAYATAPVLSLVLDRDVPGVHLTPPPILIPIITSHLMVMMLQREQLNRIYNSNRTLCYQLNHSVTVRGTHRQTPTCTSPRLFSK